MSLATRSPRSRKSLSAVDTNININDNFTLPVTNKGKRRVVASMGGEGIKDMDAASLKADNFSLKSNPSRNVVSLTDEAIKSCCINVECLF